MQNADVYPMPLDAIRAGCAEAKASSRRCSVSGRDAIRAGCAEAKFRGCQGAIALTMQSVRGRFEADGRFLLSRTEQ